MTLDCATLPLTTCESAASVSTVREFRCSSFLHSPSSALQGQVVLRLNHPPAAEDSGVTVPSQKPLTFQLPHSDADGDILYCIITALPTRGMPWKSGELHGGPQFGTLHVLSAPVSLSLNAASGQ